MSVRSGYADMVIDYASLACFWSRLTDPQKRLIHHEQFDYLPEDTEVRKESVIIVWSKLTDPQKKLIHSGFFHDLATNGRVSRARKRMLIEAQNKHEIITDQKLVNKIGKTKKKKKGPPGVPGPKATRQISKLAEKIGHLRCWYTNEDCHITSLRTAWSATREHIIPQVYGWNGKNRNTAIAASFINNVLGCAPIHVKMHVKNELSKISCFPTLNGEQKREIYERVVKNILEQYRVCGSLPWDNPAKCKPNKSARKNAKSLIIEMAYWRHMIIQKNYVDNIQRNSNNIRDYLEENCDGMETGIEQAYGLRGNSS
ncbi:hypothetical protein LCGC14_0746380 [marine sediment metagenome]|uniref:Uncharacterized protein n=1 Tax=marine sediment metagenome TaxID=412755 RepID=A0A0F9TC95_9ZZZZ